MTSISCVVFVGAISAANDVDGDNDDDDGDDVWFWKGQKNFPCNAVVDLPLNFGFIGMIFGTALMLFLFFFFFLYHIYINVFDYGFTCIHFDQTRVGHI